MKCDNCKENMVKTTIIDEDTGALVEIYRCFHCGNEEKAD